MTLEQLRIFLAVARIEHVTQAAFSLNLTQSAVSASIAALEASHGVRLFERTGRRIALSEAGRLFVDEAQAVLARAETARLALSDWSRHIMGSVRVHASQTVANYWLPSRLIRMREKHPRVEISLTIGNSLQVTRAVLEGMGDLGLVEGAVTQEALCVCCVAEDEMALVIGYHNRLMQNPLTGRPSFSVCDYLKLRWILREAGSGTRACFEAHLARHGLVQEQLDCVLELPSNEAVLAAVIAGDGVSVLSMRAVALAVAAGHIQAFPLAEMTRSFTVLWRRQRSHTRATQALLALLSEGVRVT